MNEVQAAYGSLQLKHVDEYIEKRRKIVDYYNQLLGNVKGIRTIIQKNGHRTYAIPTIRS